MSMEQLTINNYPIPSKENKKVVVINDLGRIRQKITGDRNGLFYTEIRVKRYRNSNLGTSFLKSF